MIIRFLNEDHIRIHAVVLASVWASFFVSAWPSVLFSVLGASVLVVDAFWLFDLLPFEGVAAGWPDVWPEVWPDD